MCHNRSAATFPIFSQPSNATVSQRRKVNATVHYSVRIISTVSMQLKAAHGVKSSDKYHMTELTYGPQTTLFIFVLWDFTKLKPCSPTLSIHTNCCIFFFFNFLVFSIFGFPQQQIMVGPLLAPCQLSIFHQSLDWGSFYQISPHIFHNISLAKFAF